MNRQLQHYAISIFLLSILLIASSSRAATVTGVVESIEVEPREGDYTAYVVIDPDLDVDGNEVLVLTTDGTTQALIETAFEEQEPISIWYRTKTDGKNYVDYLVFSTGVVAADKVASLKYIDLSCEDGNPAAGPHRDFRRHMIATINADAFLVTERTLMTLLSAAVQQNDDVVPTNIVTINKTIGGTTLRQQFQGLEVHR